MDVGGGDDDSNERREEEGGGGKKQCVSASCPPRECIYRVGMTTSVYVCMKDGGFARIVRPTGAWKGGGKKNGKGGECAG